MAAAFWLSFLFGPLGAFYAGGLVGTLALILSVGLAVFTFGLSLLLTWPATIAATMIAVSNSNSKYDWYMAQQEGK
jgi:hypothetical protein